jgi:magnesium transporter
MGQDDPVLQATVFTPGGAEDLDDMNDVSDAIERDDVLVWVDVLDPTEEDLACIQAEFNLHDLAIDDIRKSGQRPKLDTYTHHAFVVVYGPNNKDPRDLPEVEIVLGKNWLITVRSRCAAGTAFETDEVRERLLRPHDNLIGPGFFLYVVLDEIVNGYFDTADQIENKLEVLEAGLFEDDPTQQLRDQDIARLLLEVRRDLIALRRKLTPMRDVVFEIIGGEVAWVESSSIVYFQNVLDHLLRVLDQIDAQRDLLGSVVDAHLGLQSNRMNEVMKRMTSWGAILIVATLIAGIYGMNFKHMPELGWSFGYPAALGTMAIITVSMYLWFKKRDWL